MQQTHQQIPKKNDQKLKLIKDFGFLLQLKPIPITEYCTKYILAQGQSNLILRQDDQSFDMVYSYTKYDYEGKTLIHINCAKTSNAQKGKYELDMRYLLLSMKVKEKAWFNICDVPVYSSKKIAKNACLEGQHKDNENLNSQEDLPIIETQQTQIQHQPKQQKLHNQAEKIQSDDTRAEEFQYIDSSPEVRTGFHYEVFMERVQYKNSDSFESKIKVFEQKREEAKILFKQKKYQQAAKIYSFLDSITSNLRKFKKDPQTGNNINEPFYTPQQSLQLQDKNLKAKINFLRTFFKMIERTSAEQKQQAKKTIQFLLQKQDENPVVHYLHAKWLLYLRYLDSALDAAKRSYKLQGNPETRELIALIHHEIVNKHKIKVKVPVDQKP